MKWETNSFGVPCKALLHESLELVTLHKLNDQKVGHINMSAWGLNWHHCQKLKPRNHKS
jgi:hypothetical protein